MVSFDGQTRTVEPSMTSLVQLEKLAANAQTSQGAKKPSKCFFHLELTSFQLETSTSKPWGVSSTDMQDVERKVVSRSVFAISGQSPYANPKLCGAGEVRF